VNFDAMNEQLVALKESDGAPNASYYFGLVNPAATFNDYCSYSCVTGQSYVVDSASDGSYRVGAGVGFSGEDSAWTLAHELGHMHGRGHAPCDVSTSDYFPYSGGMIGTWGYDPRSGKFLNPADYADFTSYCEPMWTSDYTYQALFDRVIAIGALAYSLQPSASYRFLRVSADGSLDWGAKVVLSTRPAGRSGEIRYLDDHGNSIAIGKAAIVDVSRAGKASWLVPEPPVGTRQVQAMLPRHGSRTIALLDSGPTSNP
jgi:hypothetical protein